MMNMHAIAPIPQGMYTNDRTRTRTPRQIVEVSASSGGPKAFERRSAPEFYGEQKSRVRLWRSG
jgi:hypothetical protein